MDAVVLQESAFLAVVQDEGVLQQHRDRQSAHEMQRIFEDASMVKKGNIHSGKEARYAQYNGNGPDLPVPFYYIERRSR